MTLRDPIAHPEELKARQITHDAFLGGALEICQPQRGFRAGIDAVLLAACVPVATDERQAVLDCGAGVGTAGLCVARRCATADVVLFEREPELVVLAEENIRRNDLATRVRVIEGHVAARLGESADRGLQPERFAHVIANPPYRMAGNGTPPLDDLKAASNAMPDHSLERWVRFMTRMAAPRGKLTMIHAAESLGLVLELLQGRFGALRVLPVYARQNAPAIRVIVSGMKASRAPMCILPGFQLHEEGHGFTRKAAEILRQGAALDLWAK